MQHYLDDLNVTAPPPSARAPFPAPRTPSWTPLPAQLSPAPFGPWHTPPLAPSASHVPRAQVRYKDEPGHNHGREAPTRTTTKIARCARGRLALQRQCRSYRKVNFTDELEDMAASARNLAAPAYIRATMSHKFCMAAPGADLPRGQ